MGERLKESTWTPSGPLPHGLGELNSLLILGQLVFIAKCFLPKGLDSSNMETELLEPCEVS